MDVLSNRLIYSAATTALVFVVAVGTGVVLMKPEQTPFRGSAQLAENEYPLADAVADVAVPTSAPLTTAPMNAGYMPRSQSAKIGSSSLQGARAGGIADFSAETSAAQGRDRFEHYQSNPVRLASEAPVSTFSIDVDTASYSFVRRRLNEGVLPQKDAVRTEELLNYFSYDYPRPENRSVPFKPTVSVVDSPWRAGNKLVHIGIRGYELPDRTKPDSNLVFLLDVSGSMNAPDKLPLVKQSIGLLLDQLKPTDTLSIVVYAGAAGTVLEPTQIRDRQKILAALRGLSAGGSTAGGAGIERAYELARSSFREGAVNRVILATDGDFNVGITSREQLKGFVERQREQGIYLTVLGFGHGNYHDHLMQELAQNGNGIAAYIDTLSEARKLLVDQATSTLFTIASDVKLQVEFNPAMVQEYRLIGYETRALKREDFNNDRVDAGDIGSGHTVTALYEITPVGKDSGLLDALRYGQQDSGDTNISPVEYGFLKIRYKLPGEKSSSLIQQAISSQQEVQPDSALEREINFALAVAGFADLLRGGVYSGDWSFDEVLALALANRGHDAFGYRSEFVQLVRKAKTAKSGF